MKSPHLLVIHGPNLNWLGHRDRGFYGKETLDEINLFLADAAQSLDMQLSICQSNQEGTIVEWIHSAIGRYDGIVINPGGFTYSSIAIRDAICLSKLPAVEVHLSNISERESFRRHSIIAPVCIGQISGFKFFSYILGIQALQYHYQQAGIDAVSSTDCQD